MESKAKGQKTRGLLGNSTFFYAINVKTLCFSCNHRNRNFNCIETTLMQSRHKFAIDFLRFATHFSTLSSDVQREAELHDKPLGIQKAK